MRFDMKEKCGKKEENDNEEQRECLDHSQNQGMRLWERKYLSLRESSVFRGELDFN